MFDTNRWSLKIRGKIGLGYFMILILLGLFLLIVSARIRGLEKETVFISEHDMQVHELTYKIEKNVLDMETGQRGYALTGDADYLAPYNNGLVEWRINYAKLSSIIMDNPSQVVNLRGLQKNIELWINEAGQYVVDLKRNGNETSVEHFFRNDPGKPIIDLVREQAELFRSSERLLTNKRIHDMEDNNQTLLITMYVLWSVVAFISAIAAIIISRSIVSTLNDVIKAIHNIVEKRNMSERIEVSTRDEIYDLGQAANRLLDVVEREQWSSEQLGQMSIALQESHDLHSLSRIFINRLSAVLEMQYGTIYIINKFDQLERVYTYAGAGNMESLKPIQTIHFGEGLVGQCAIDQKILMIDNLPDDYIRIQSALGKTAPRYAVIAPVLFENRTIAVIEAASLMRWDSHHLELLNQVLKMMGVSLNSVLTRKEIQDLYAESQAMNEELQSQSEELQVQSEELQNHTKELMVLNTELVSQKNMAEQAAIELVKYNDQLEESSRYKSEFLANMSHELRTPLNSMLILSQLLAEKSNEVLQGEELEYAGIIHSAGSELLVLINNILDLSKVEAGKMLVEADAVNLTELPSLLYGYFETTAANKNLSFSVFVTSEVPDLFYTDELRLHQILRNLISNAFKFTETGGVKIEITKLEFFRSSQYASETPVLAFIVKDSGIGIPEDKSEMIFEAFQQADGSTVRKFGGTGLGLTISLQLAQLLGGHITVESQEGVGSTFTLLLPCRDEGFETENENSPSESALEAAAASELGSMNKNDNSGDINEQNYKVLHGKTVLIVDDDNRNLFALKSGLELYDMNILTAQNGFECLQYVRENPAIDIVLLDIMMPHLDGYDTLSIIREELEMTGLPIIAISAKSMKEERDKCLAAGATDFLGKPVQLKEVITRMCKWLENSSA
ncbi:CHASE3 domain-containing protein [Paenibacillus sp. sgz500958]|uniref:CHASE3 domain-containing protein n=1 Tax=Paenibacillus sp. sgz500958 TaxID=3242475 RepID=UPI0036D3E199